MNLLNVFANKFLFKLIGTVFNYAPFKLIGSKDTSAIVNSIVETDHLFSKWNPFYESLKWRNTWVLNGLNYLLGHYFSNLKVFTALDIGCGSNSILAQIAPLLVGRGGVFTFFDKIEKSVEASVAKIVSHNISGYTIVAEVDNKKVWSVIKQVDYINAIGLVEYLSNETFEYLIMQIKLHLKHKGRVIISTTMSGHGIDRFLRIVYGIKFNYKSVEYINDVLKRNNLEVIGMRTTESELMYVWVLKHKDE